MGRLNAGARWIGATLFAAPEGTATAASGRLALGRRLGSLWPGAACGLALLLFCYRPVLVGGEQFAFRDAAHFYYPLYQYVQQEWDAGRWPLWDPGQNGGAPLLGNPATAVLYPGKLIYAAFPYAWAARLYVVAHTALAFAGAYALVRPWGVSRAGACLAGMSYAFGAPVLFQGCNVIFLVGAAWAPWGFLALDRLLRLRERTGLLGLAVVLAMQVLGGDPEAAYVTALCGVGYALILARQDRGEASPLPPPGVRRRAFAALAVGLAWVAAVTVSAYAAPRVAGPHRTILRWAVAAAVFGGLALAAGVGRLGRPRRDRFVTSLLGLGGACALAVMLAAVQIGPTLEFTSLSVRAADEPLMDIFHYSLDPWRVAEAIWPSAFGPGAPENRSWLQAVPPAGLHTTWEDSIYVGGLTLVLALGAAGVRGVGPWRAWLSAVAVASLAASFGRYAGPLWWLRWIPAARDVFGGHDPLSFSARADGVVVDGFGSPYGLLAALLPGFAAFRFPSKLLTFTSLAASALAGLGWDALAAGRTRRPVVRWCAWGLVATAALMALLFAVGLDPAAVFAGRLSVESAFGPVDLPAALAETRRALAHGGLMLSLGLGLAILAPRRPRAAGVAAVVAMAIDLAAANARLVWTAPQADFDAEPLAAALIREAERKEPSPGPFRVHRMTYWEPAAWNERRSSRRFSEMLAWSRATLQELHGLPLGVAYTRVSGGLELLDHLDFFGPEDVLARGNTAAALGVPDGQPIVYFPRRSFDLWNTRYFLVPVVSAGWAAPDRSYASLLPETERLYPESPRLAESGPEGWSRTRDWQLLRNSAAFPRAWVVHSARVSPPLVGEGKVDLLRDLLYPGDAFWSDPSRTVTDLRATAFVETDDPAPLRDFLPGLPTGADESVTVTRHEPQRVELAASLTRPGLVILADTYYPGWQLTIDGVPAPVVRVNRMMRGAAVGAGTHRLVYTYRPAPFRVGLWISAAGLACLAALIPWAVRNGGSQAGLDAQYASDEMISP